MSIAYSRETLADGIGYTAIVDPKFKTNVVRIRLLTELHPDTVSANALAFGVLGACNSVYQDLAVLTAKLNALYGTNIGVDIAKRGDLQMLSLSVNAIDNRYALEAGEDVTGDALDILLTCLFSPNAHGGAFAETMFGPRRKDLLDTIEAEINNKRSYAVHRAQQTIFQDEPAAVSSYGTMETAEAVTPASAYAAYRTLLETAQFEIYCVSSTPLPAVRGKLEAAFRQIQRKPNKLSVFAPSPIKAVPAEIREQLDVGQSKLVMAYKTDCEDFRAIRLMNTIFGATPFSKLFLNVREKLSLCYYCASGYQETKRTLLIDSGIEIANYEKARAEIEAQLQAMREGCFSDEDMDNALLSIYNSIRSTGDTPSDWIGWYFSQYLRGTALSPEEEIAVTQAEMQDREAVRKRIIAAAASMRLDTVYLMQQKEGE